MGWYSEYMESKAIEQEMDTLAQKVMKIQNVIFYKTQELKAEHEARHDTVAKFLSGEIDGLKLALDILKGAA